MKSFPLGVAALLAICALPAHADGCGAPATPVHAIQGRADESPLAGSVRTVEAVVVASFQGEHGLNGFFVQEEDDDADDDPSTSEGLFIYAPRRRAVARGDLVRVRGAVAEFHGLTELTRVRDLQRCGRVALPAATRLVPDGEFERLEGMLVEVDGPLVVTDSHDPGRRNQLLLAVGERQFQPTQLSPPGIAAIRRSADNRRRRLILDDGSSRRKAGDQRAPVRAGDRIAMLRGVIDQFDDDYRLQPIDRPGIEAANPRPPAPARHPPEQMRVVAFNLRNYFNGNGNGGGFPTARGADSRTAFQLQRQKLVAALGQLSPDILGVMEIENDGFSADSAIADLAAALGQAVGTRYSFIDPGSKRLGRDAIAVGLLYRPDRVQPVGPPAVLDSHIDARFAARNRPSLAQTFAFGTSRERATVVVNHFKSKGSSCAEQGDPDRGDGQHACADTRLRAAEALADWLETDPTHSRDPDILIVGDLNAYAREDPLRALASAGYVDLIARHLGSREYSYVFDGFAGYLDHALASTPMARRVTKVVIWHINADEPPAVGYDGGKGAGGPFRSSDHDPVIVDFHPGGARSRPVTAR